MSKLLNLIFVPFFTLLLMWAIGWLWFATSIAITKPYEKITTDYIDAIVVLTGDSGRIKAGLELFSKQPKKIFISGANKNTTKKDILKNSKITLPSSINKIAIGYQATDTISNASEVKEWVEKNDIKSFYLVTSSYHMQRATLEIKNQLPNTNIVQYPVLTDDFQSWQGRFWSLTFSEYNKTLIRWMQTFMKKG